MFLRRLRELDRVLSFYSVDAKHHGNQRHSIGRVHVRHLQPVGECHVTKGSHNSMTEENAENDIRLCRHQVVQERGGTPLPLFKFIQILTTEESLVILGKYVIIQRRNV